MSRQLRSSPVRQARFALPAAAAIALSGAASAQFVTYSIDWKSPTVGIPNSCTGVPITEGDVLGRIPALGPLPPPCILETAGVMAPGGLALALYPLCIGHPGGTPCKVEVDALSAGLDMRALGIGNGPPFWAFSVERAPMGIGGIPLPPAVWTESPCGDAATDVFSDLGLPPGPLPPMLPLAANTGIVDGDGLPNPCSGFVYPGLGLLEGPPGTIGRDNLDGLDMDVPDRFFPRTTCTYFSLDSAFIDPVSGVANSGSAVAHGFVGGDVIMTCPTCGPAVYAPAFLLGLDLFGPPDSDDLDALALVENGIPGYQRSTVPYDWLSGATDMLLFSVRRGSRVIGLPDAFFGLPIEPGDILTTGPVGAPPGIFIAAENLGLMTMRTHGIAVGDDLDALDTLHEPQPGGGYCFGDGTGTACPCGNNGAPGRGCANSANAFGALLWATGSSSISNDHVILTASGMTPSTSCLFFQGTVPFLAGVVFDDGLRCAGGNVIRLGPRTALCGSREFGYTVPGDPPVHIAGLIGAPGVYYYQVWYRDAAVFCTAATDNLTNGYRIAWTP